MNLCICVAKKCFFSRSEMIYYKLCAGPVRHQLEYCAQIREEYNYYSENLSDRGRNKKRLRLNCAQNYEGLQ